MLDMTKTSRLNTVRLSAVGCAIGLLSLQAAAQSSPWYVGLNQRFEHQNNVFQTATGQISDTVSTTSLVGGLDQPIGRQRLFGTASLGTVRFQNRAQLNYDAYNGQLGVNWETAGNLSGTVALDASQSLADFTPIALPGVTSNNTTNTVGGRVTARMGVVTRMTVEVGAATRRTRYDNPLYQIRDVDIDEVFGGVRYRPAGSLVLGIGLRATRGEYPKFRNPAPGRYTSEGFDRNNVDLSAEWPLSGASAIDARLSFGKDKYDTVTARNFSGVTGALTWRWQPTGRTAMTTSFTRRSGDDATVNFLPGQLPYATSATRESNALAVAVDYDLTGKIKARAGLSATEQTAVDLLLGTSSREFLTAATLGFAWEATRAIRAGCDVAQRSRSTRAGVPGYDATTFGCFGEFVLR
jgi:hypothetical protein